MTDLRFLQLPTEDAIGKGWYSLFQTETQKNYFKSLDSFLAEEAESGKTILPEKANIFKAFELCHLEDVKVVILGQDPYYQEDQKGKADGLAFSYNSGWIKPDNRDDSLSNILKQLQIETGLSTKNKTSLVPWAKRGVLLLNTVLSVEKGKPNSHQKKGWEIFTNAVIKAVNEKEEPCVFILWGGKAQEKEKLINRQKILNGSHPCPMSAKGFFKTEDGNDKQYFNAANDLLGPGREIDWSLDDL